MKGYIINNNDNIFYQNQNGIYFPIPILSGEYLGKFFLFENSIDLFPEIFENLTYEIVDLDMTAFQRDYTLPEVNPYYLEVLPEFLGVFKDNKFVFGKYEFPLYDIEGKKCVNTAHFGWQQFKNDLDERMPDGTFRHQALKDVLMPLWDNLALQVENNNFIIV